MYDVIVIGAGVEGSATGYALAKRGLNVLMIEQFGLPHHRGSSHGYSRITRYAYAEDYHVRMMVDAFKIWDELEKASSTQLYIPTGIVQTADANSPLLKSVETSLKSVGIKHELLRGKSLRDRFPMITYDDTLAAVYESAAGILRADRCLAALQSQFRKLGGTIHDAEPVVQVTPVSAHRAIVKTVKSSYEARSVVIAAGTWTSRFTERLGLQLPLQPKRIEVWYWKKTNDEAYGSIEKGSPVFLHTDGHDEVYGLPSVEYPGLVKVCYHGGSDCNPDVRDAHSNDERYRKLTAEFIRKHLPGIELTPAVTETCMYTMTPDEKFILDHHPQWKNIVIGAGFSGHGFKFAPVIGEILADFAVKGHHDKFDMKPFQISRFLSHQQVFAKL